MKRTLLALVLTLGLPLAAHAQQGPPPSGMGPNKPMMMQHHMSDADRMKMMQMHNQARASILKALTPAHKALLQSLVGDLSVSATPDAKAAAAKLDAQLTPAEKSAITSAAGRMHDQMHAMMPSPPPGAPIHRMHEMSNDPGELLLMMSAMSIMGDDGMMHAMPQ